MKKLILFVSLLFGMIPTIKEHHLKFIGLECAKAQYFAWEGFTPYANLEATPGLADGSIKANAKLVGCGGCSDYDLKWSISNKNGNDVIGEVYSQDDIFRNEEEVTISNLYPGLYNVCVGGSLKIGNWEYVNYEWVTSYKKKNIYKCENNLLVRPKNCYTFSPMPIITDADYFSHNGTAYFGDPNDNNKPYLWYTITSDLSLPFTGTPGSPQSITLVDNGKGLIERFWPGMYSYYVVDKNFCNASGSFTIAEKAGIKCNILFTCSDFDKRNGSITISNITSTNGQNNAKYYDITCLDQSGNNISGQAVSGTMVYTGLSIGSYKITITSKDGTVTTFSTTSRVVTCSGTVQINVPNTQITAGNGLGVGVIDVTNTISPRPTNSVTFLCTNNSTGITYTLTGTAYNNLPAGTYTISATDVYGGTISNPYVVVPTTCTNPTFNISSANIGNDDGKASGYVVASISSTKNWKIKSIDGMSTQYIKINGGIFSNVPAGTYEITGINPSDGCITTSQQFTVPLASFNLSSDDKAILKLLYDDTNDAGSGKCHGTRKAPGSTSINFQPKALIAHLLIQEDYVRSTSGAFVEYSIPNPAYGNNGYADIANTLTGEIFEIKNAQTASEMLKGSYEVVGYRDLAKQWCDKPAVGQWVLGYNYPINSFLHNAKYFPDPYQASRVIEAKLYFDYPGVIGYNYISRSTSPVQVPVAPPMAWVDIVNELMARRRNLQYATMATTELVITYFNQLKKADPNNFATIKAEVLTIGGVILIGLICQAIITNGGSVLTEFAIYELAFTCEFIILKM